MKVSALFTLQMVMLLLEKTTIRYIQRFLQKITKIINGKSVNIGDPTSLLPQGIGSGLSFSEFKPQS